MNTRLPLVRQLSWFATIPQVVALGTAVGLGWFLTHSAQGVAAGALAYLAYSIGSRWLLLGAHRRGMQLLQAGQYEEAISEFEASYAFLGRHRWLDRYRSITLMSPSAISYREMALVNIAFAYAQLGQGAKAKEYYRRTLDEFPDSVLARMALKFIESVEQPA